MGLTFGGMVRSGELVETESRDADRAFVTDRAVKTERRMLAAARAERGKGQAQAEPVAVEVSLLESGSMLNPRACGTMTGAFAG